jgi:hypothetical protein
MVLRRDQQHRPALRQEASEETDTGTMHRAGKLSSKALSAMAALMRQHAAMKCALDSMARKFLPHEIAPNLQQGHALPALRVIWIRAIHSRKFALVIF